MPPYFLGIDIGATKSHAMVADEDGRALGFGRAGPGNHQTVGYEGMSAALRRAACEALEMAGANMEQVAGAGFGVAGFDWPSQRTRMLETVRQALELRSDVPVALTNDVLLGLVAGTDEGWGWRCRRARATTAGGGTGWGGRAA